MASVLLSLASAAHVRGELFYSSALNIQGHGVILPGFFPVRVFVLH